MVKRQKEKQYQSAREHRNNASLRAGSSSSASVVQRKLPFHCCALTLTPFEHPVCLQQEETFGIIFENEVLVSFLLQHKVDPVTGKPMSTSRDVITLHMDKDEEGRWQCPVLTKPLTDFQKIVAVIQPNTTTTNRTANVYSYEAYYELNVKTKNYEDLVSGVKFTKQDVLILNDPGNTKLEQLRDINRFHHIRMARQQDKQQSDNTNSSGGSNVKHSVTATRILEKIQQQQQKAADSMSSAAAAAGSKRDSSSTEDSLSGKKLKIFSDAVTGVKMTSGKVSGSFTSTTMDIVQHDDDIREATQEEILTFQFQLMRKRKKKGYATLHTNLGDIGLELHCDIAPRTCTNFLGLAEQGKYNNTKFHRLIKNFMIQGGKGDPEESLWGEPFVDEFDDRLKHTGPGVLSMANAGPKTNKMQFFLTFKSCNHLDRKHSVFGRVVQGLEVLQAMEKISTDKKDRPTSEIKITSIEVLVNPAREAEEAERKRIQERSEVRRAEEGSRKAAALGRTVSSGGGASIGKLPAPVATTANAPAVGKYLPKKAGQQLSQDKDLAAHDESAAAAKPTSRLPPPPKKTSFGDFSGW